jgi:replicative DNA helicase
MPDFMSSLDERKKKEHTGIPCGFPSFDAFTDGFQNEDMIVIGSFPSVGKTALALNMATHIALNEKRTVAVFSLEMNTTSTFDRMMASQTGIDFRSFRNNGRLSSEESRRVGKAANDFYYAPILLLDSPNMYLSDLCATARKLRSRDNPVEIIFIDYLGLISTEDSHFKNRNEQLSDISRTLKNLACELKIPIVVLTQISRDVKNGKPSLTSLRDSGTLAEDADVVMFLHRNADNSNQDTNEIRKIDLIVEKQRNGPIGNLSFGFNAKYLRFQEITD